MRETLVFENFHEFFKNRDRLSWISSTKEVKRNKGERAREEAVTRTLLKKRYKYVRLQLSKSVLCRCHVEKECLRRLCERRSSKAFGGVFVRN